MPDLVIVGSFVQILQAFAPCFTAPSFCTFVVLACGWAQVLDRHTITAVVRAARAVGWKHIRSFHRFFAAARWVADEVGLVVLRMVDALVPADEPLVVAVDDTLGRHTGKKIAAASMHRDPLLSTGKKPIFHWGHLWVVAGVTVPAFGKAWCLPVLVRLYRGKKRCQAEGRTYRKTTELAADLIRLLAKALPHRRIIVVGDSAYTNCTVIKKRPPNVTIVGRGRLDAALYEPPPSRRPGQRGRPRVRGASLPSPAAQIAAPKVRWRTVTADVYGETVTVKVFVINALWYVAAGSEMMRLIVVRGFPGHERDDVFVSTDPKMEPKTIIETIGLRWPLEVAFHEVKGKLGFEHPQNRVERAVERTAPIALWLYSLTVTWYLKAGQHHRAARHVALPWYREKTSPAFSDMLATLRRASWFERLLDPHAVDPTVRKQIRPLLEYLEAVT